MEFTYELFIFITHHPFAVAFAYVHYLQTKLLVLCFSVHLFPFHLDFPLVDLDLHLSMLHPNVSYEHFVVAPIHQLHSFHPTLRRKIKKRKKIFFISSLIIVDVKLIIFLPLRLQLVPMTFHLLNLHRHRLHLYLVALITFPNHLEFHLLMLPHILNLMRSLH